MQIPSSEVLGEDLFQSTDGLLMSDNEGKVVLINDVGRKIWGLKKSVSEGFDIRELMIIASNKARNIELFLNGVMKTIDSKNRVVRLEIPLIDGKTIDCHTFPLIGADNKIHGRIWYSRDITERKKVEDMQNLHHIMMENLGEGIVLTKAIDGEIVYSNKRFEKIFGYKRNELIGKCICILNAPQDSLDSVGVHRKICNAVKENGEWYGLIKSQKKDGTEIWTEVKSVGINHSQHGDVLVSIREDVTEKILSDKKLQESEKRYRVLFENSRDAILFITTNGQVLGSNSSAQRLFGYSPEDFKKMTREKLVDITDTRIHELIKHRDKFAYFRGRFRVIRRDGKKIECEGTSVIYKDKNGFEQINIVLREVGIEIPQ